MKWRKMNIRLSAMFMIIMSITYKTSQGRERHAEIVATVDGDTMYQVLEPDAIPAIRHPEFVSGDAAKAQMSDDEMIMGVIINNEPRAYSLWQLDAHEIVNDQSGMIKFAVTW